MPACSLAAISCIPVTGSNIKLIMAHSPVIRRHEAACVECSDAWAPIGYEIYICTGLNAEHTDAVLNFLDPEEVLVGPQHRSRRVSPGCFPHKYLDRVAEVGVQPGKPTDRLFGFMPTMAPGWITVGPRSKVSHVLRH